MKVALVFDYYMEEVRSMLGGVIRYVADHRHIKCRLIMLDGVHDPIDLTGYDAMVTPMYFDWHQPLYQQLKIAYVDLSPCPKGACTTLSDNEKVGELAARHLVNSGLVQFAYCEFGRNHLDSDAVCSRSELRYRGFHDELKRCGFPTQSVSSYNDREELGDWLESLPKPIGVFAYNDYLGNILLETCEDRGLRVPEQVSVIGVDNSKAVCGLARPALSSVDISLDSHGFETLGYLDQHQGPFSGELIRKIGPKRVVERGSTGVFIIEDPHVLRAMEFIEQNHKNSISVDSVCRVSGINRRNLEKKFKQIRRRTIHEEIVNYRLNYIKVLLCTTDMSIDEIAEMSHFTYVRNLYRLFKQHTGCSPKEYRRLYSQVEL